MSRRARGRPTRGIEPSSPQVYGCCGSRKTARFGALLDDAARVHDDHPLGDLRDDAHVVRDEQDRRAVVAPEASSSARGSAPGSSRRARSSARRRSGAPGCRRAPSRSSRAAACRRRTGAGSRRRVARGSGCRPRASSSIARARACLRVRSLVRAELLGDLPADRVHRVQRRHRVLEDHRDLAAADRAHLASARAAAGRARVEDLARDDRVRVADQPHHGHHRDGLAGARLADDRRATSPSASENDRPSTACTMPPPSGTIRSGRAPPAGGSGMTDPRVEQA